MKKDKRFLIIAILWFIFTIILLTLPGSVLPKETWFDKIWADKWVHIFLFAILVILWSKAFHERRTERKDLKWLFFWLMLAGILYGITMEFIQKYFIPNRSFDVGDIAADSVGCLIGFIYSTRRYIKK